MAKRSLGGDAMAWWPCTMHVECRLLIREEWRLNTPQTEAIAKGQTVSVAVRSVHVEICKRHGRKAVDGFGPGGTLAGTGR